MSMIKCLFCKERFEPDEHLEESDTVMCPGCNEEMEVISVDPVKVRKLKKGDSDYEEEDYDDDEPEFYGNDINYDHDPRGYDD